MMLLLACSAPFARAQTPSPGALKAAFLSRFPQYVEWPQDAFASPDAPFVFGLLGRHPFGDVLDEIVRGEQIAGRPVIVQRYTDWRAATNCHVLFIADSERPNLNRLLSARRGRPILTVSELGGFITEGGMIQFVTTTRVQFRINLDAARDAHLNISSRLLRLADKVETTSTRP